MKLEVVIASRQRIPLVRDPLRMFPDAILCVDAKEEKAYRQAYPEQRFLTHKLNGLGHIRQHIMDKVEADAIFMVDDDVDACFSMTPTPPHRIRDTQSIRQIVENCASNAREAGTIAFWFQPKPDPILYFAFYPFQLTGTYKGWVQGFWREEFNKHIRFDTNIRNKLNIDISLRIARRYKFMWCDQRFSFRPGVHMTAKGGLSGFRTEAAMKADYDYLRRKHGNVITMDHKGELRSILRVKGKKQS